MTGRAERTDSWSSAGPKPLGFDNQAPRPASQR
jgi:hypothetical protein